MIKHLRISPFLRLTSRLESWSGYGVDAGLPHTCSPDTSGGKMMLFWLLYIIFIHICKDFKGRVPRYMWSKTTYWLPFGNQTLQWTSPHH